MIELPKPIQSGPISVRYMGNDGGGSKIVCGWTAEQEFWIRDNNGYGPVIIMGKDSAIELFHVLGMRADRVMFEPVAEVYPGIQQDMVTLAEYEAAREEWRRAALEERKRASDLETEIGNLREQLALYKSVEELATEPLTDKDAW